jgi:hypothetical protein
MLRGMKIHGKLPSNVPLGGPSPDNVILPHRHVYAVLTNPGFTPSIPPLLHYCKRCGTIFIHEDDTMVPLKALGGRNSNYHNRGQRWLEEQGT